MALKDSVLASPAQLQALHAEALRQYAQTAPRLTAAGALFGLLVGWLQWPVVEPADVARWATLMGCALASRLALVVVHRRLGTPVEPAPRWLRRYRLTVLATGVAWGLSALWLFPAGEPHYQAHLFFVLMAVAIAGSNMLSFDATAVALFAIPAFGPVAFRLWLAGGEPAFVWGAAIFIPYQIWTSMRHCAAVRESTLLRWSESERALRANTRLEALLADVGERMGQAVPEGSGYRQAWHDGAVLPAATAAALVEQCHQLAELVRTTREGVWFIDEQGRTSDLNPAMCALLGGTRDALIGRTIFDFVDDENAAVFRSQLQRRRAGDRGSYELTLTRLDGTRVHCVNNATPLTNLDGRTVGSVGLWTDISDLKGTESRLREYEFALNAMSSAVSLQARRDGRFIYQMVNDAWCRITGVAREQALGREGRDLAGLVDRDERLRQISAAADQRRTITYRGRSEFEGRVATMETVFHPIIEPGRDVDRIIVVTRDVTEEEQASAALHDSLRNLRLALDAIGDGIFASGAVSADEPVLFHNERMLDMWALQVAPDEVLTPRKIMQRAAALFVDPAAQLQRVGEIISGNLFSDDRVRLNDGRVLRRRCFPFADQGHMVRVWSFADVTAEEDAVDALRAAEARQRALIEAFPGYIACLDADLRYVFVNARLRQKLGLDEADIVGRRLGEVPGTENSHESADAAVRALAGETVVIERHWPDQAELITFAPGPDIGNAPMCYAFGIDITAQKRAQAQLLTLKEEAERANLAKSEFLSGMSHELRTPLNAIIGFAEVLEADQDPPLAAVHRPLVHDMLAGGRHLLALINEVLDLARVEAGKLEVAAEPVELGPLLAECGGLVASLARAHEVRLELGVMPGESLWLLGDRIRLKQVLLNLLSNAVKYNRRGGRVRVVVSGLQGGWHIEVHDQGEGLTEAQQRRLFLPFERLNADRSGIEGTGIGLALSRRLVDLMRGRIGVHSRPGQGSCFWIWLPAASGAGATEAPRPPEDGPPQASAEQAPTLAGSVLYVDESGFETSLLHAALQGFSGLEVRTAQGEDDCMAAVAEQIPSLILLNVERAGLDHGRLLRALRDDERTRSIPVVSLSCGPAPTWQGQDDRTGFADHLRRPFDRAVLHATLRRVLQPQ